MLESKTSFGFTPQYRSASTRSLHSAALLLSAALATLVGFSSIARADQTLTLELPPSQAAKEMQSANQQSAAHTNVVPKHSKAYSQGRYRPGAPSRGSLSSRGQGVRETVIGKLGQLNASHVIRRRRTDDSPKLTTAPSGTYLAIQEDNGDWYGVLMADGSTGWIPKQAVHVLEYQVISEGRPSYTPDLSARGDSSLPTGMDDIYPYSSTSYFTGDPNTLLSEAYRYLGVPYVWGGNTENGIDCSGFVKNVFSVCGYASLPRLGSDQMAYGTPVPVDQLQPGDRLYFGKRTERVGIKHTAIYVGNGYFIHASSSKHQVVVSRLSESYYTRNFVCARR